VKVVLDFAAGPGLSAQLAGFSRSGLDITICPEGDEPAYRTAMRSADVLWHVLKRCSAEVIAGAPHLRLIQKIGAGVNTIDVDAAVARSIAVCNLPGTNAPAVAEMTLLLMLAALRRLPMLDRLTRAGRGWPIDPALQDSFRELGGKTVGLVGYGAIPKALAPVLRAMGCRILYFARSEKPGALGEYHALPALLEQSDVVSLHVPLTPETARLIDAAAFARMKPGAVFVNTARGGLVDEAALLAGLTSGRIGAAGLDVFAVEPAGVDNPLFALDNVAVAPHLGWLSTGTFDRSFGLAADNCHRLRDSRPLLHRVA
jgi:phosphoglycerate dehydrogenase-like enzyme